VVMGIIEGSLVQKVGESGTISAIGIKFQRVLPRYSAL
jgi:hypothetical protein